MFEEYGHAQTMYIKSRRDVPVDVPLDLSMEWHELPKYNGIQISQLIYIYIYELQRDKTSLRTLGS